MIMLPTSDGLLRSERLRFPLASGSIAPRKVTLLVALDPTSAALLAHRCSFCIGKRPAAKDLEHLRDLTGTLAEGSLGMAGTDVPFKGLLAHRNTKVWREKVQKCQIGTWEMREISGRLHLFGRTLSISRETLPEPPRC